MALSVIPEEQLREAALKAVEESRVRGDQPALAEQDAFARQLLEWFKRDFFKWVCSRSYDLPLHHI